jgi:phosphonate metabolism-associated iron-containing alcohol dehydrogenase
MNLWTYRNPVRVTFGWGALDGIADLVAGRAYALVTHPDAPLAPYRQRLVDRAGPPVTVIDQIHPNPSLEMLRGPCRQLQDAQQTPELLVALGGGSVIDSTKFLAAGRGDWRGVADHLREGVAATTSALPIIAVPTTAGTGSDLTRWATIWDPENARKLSLARDDLYPEAVLVDPALTLGLPWATTLASGLDALSHALESLWNVNANPVSRGLAVSAARDILAGLTGLKANIGDRGARELMSLGALRAGLAFSNTQTALAHNISYAITLEHGIAHGLACSFCLPDVMDAALGADPRCDAALGEIFGDAPTASARLRRFLASLGVSTAFEAYGVSAEAWRAIVADAFAGPRGRNFIGAIDRFPFPPPAAPRRAGAHS